MYFVYWEYVERAAAFVQTRGETYYAEGSEAVALIRLMEKYGAEPYQEYSGMLEGQKIQNHEVMIEALNNYLQSVKTKNAWNEQKVVEDVKAILNSYMGQPPASFKYKEVTYEPKRFLTEYCNINPRDYVSFMSTLSKTYNQKGELVEADNWWHCSDYYNVNLTDFISIIRYAIEHQFSICICGDVSEPGFDRYTQCGIIPTFDIPSFCIDENARELRLTNASTTDDHCMHLIGYYKDKGTYWYVLKDSGAGAFDGEFKGYRFVSEDYIRLKMMNILLYKEGARPILDGIIK
jgi:bleomycin hydrolase